MELPQNQHSFRKILPDIFSFLFGISIAFFLAWEVKDIVWSLWLSSLVLGFMTIFIAIFGFIYSEYNKKEKRIPLIGLLMAAVFFVGFFSVHFGGFHFGHAAFLISFFPLSESSDGAFNLEIDSVSQLFGFFYQSIFKPFGLFLVPALIAERNHIFKPLIELYQAKKEGSNQPVQFTGAIMMHPYKNVVRMHLLIFFFAFAYAVKIDSFLIFAAVYFVYFFPWSILRKSKKQEVSG